MMMIPKPHPQPVGMGELEVLIYSPELVQALIFNFNLKDQALIPYSTPTTFSKVNSAPSA
jgi:hypothetical protein